MAVFGISTTWWTILYLQYTLFLRWASTLHKVIFIMRYMSHEKESHTILSSIIYHVIKNRYASPSIVILHHKHVCLFAHSDRLQQCNKQIDHIFICKYFVSWLFVVFIRLTFFFCILQLGIIKNSLYLAAVFEGISCIPC